MLEERENGAFVGEYEALLFLSGVENFRGLADLRTDHLPKMDFAFLITCFLLSRGRFFRSISKRCAEAKDFSNEGGKRTAFVLRVYMCGPFPCPAMSGYRKSSQLCIRWNASRKG